MSNPIDDFLEQEAPTIEKTAGFMDLIRGVGRGVTSLTGKIDPMKLPGGASGPLRRGAAEAFAHGGQIGQQLQSGAAFAGAGVALTGIGVAAKRISQAIDKKRDYKQMMSLDPELAELRGKDSTFFNAAYSSLRDVNPTFGGDPLTSGAMMKAMLDNPQNAGLVLAGSVKQPEAPKPGGLGLDVSFGMGPAMINRKF